jgi:predicted protein tyrosine phosphatase
MSVTGVTLNDSHSNIEEVYPKLWLGSLSAVRVIAGSDPDVHWTVITVLNSPKLISLTNALLHERIARGTCRHVLWELEDKPSAVFLSSRLKDVLELIDGVVEKHPVDAGMRNDLQRDKDNHVGETPTMSACLIHCAQGVSRSVSVAAAWYISRKQKTLKKALDLIRKARPGAAPNIGFIASLRALERSHGDVDLAVKRMTRTSE